MLIQLCTAEHDREAGGREPAERIRVARGEHERAQDDEGEEGDQRHAGDHAEFLAGHGEDEVGVRVGQDALVDALAWAPPEPAAGEDALQRRVDLKRVDQAAGRIRIEKAQDALVHVRRQFENREAAGHAHAADGDHPEPVQAGQEEERRPDDRDQHRLAEVGLEDERHDGDRQQQEGQELRRESRSGPSARLR